MKKIYFIILSILIIIYIIKSIRKNTLDIRTSFGWFLASIFMLLLSIFPKIIDVVAKFLNIKYPPTLLLTLCIIILLIINFNFSKKIAILQKKTIDLGQELSILKENIKNEKK